jgi:hypothetical protein
MVDVKIASEIDLSGFHRAAEAMARFNCVWTLSARRDRLRARAEHFATPGWQRPFWRLRARLVERKLARI